MKLLGRNTQADLARALAGLPALAAEIAEVQQKRDAAVAGDADIADIMALDLRGHELGLKLRAHHDRIAFLEHKLADEQVEQAKRDYAAAVAKLAAPLAACDVADAEYERTKIAHATAIRKVILSRENFLLAWPEGVPWPERVFVAHTLSLERLGRDLQETWQIARGHADRRPAQPSEYVARGCDAQPRGYLPTERRIREEFSTDMKTALSPPLAETKEVAA